MICCHRRLDWRLFLKVLKHLWNENISKLPHFLKYQERCIHNLYQWLHQVLLGLGFRIVHRSSMWKKKCKLSLLDVGRFQTMNHWTADYFWASQRCNHFKPTLFRHNFWWGGRARWILALMEYKIPSLSLLSIFMLVACRCWVRLATDYAVLYVGLLNCAQLFLSSGRQGAVIFFSAC